MASFSLGFSAGSAYQGSGAQLPLNFIPVWPPDAGCTGFAMSGDIITVKGTITTQAREYLARSASDGTSIKIVEFSVGSNGYNPAIPLYATIPNPDDTELEAEIYRNSITAVEQNVLVDGTAKSFVCRLSSDSIVGGIGEIGLWAEVIDSPFSSEIGEKFLFAICHQPLNVKSLRHVASYRIIIAF